MRGSTVGRSSLVTAALWMLLAGCSGPGTSDAADAAVRFATAVRSDPQQACALLAPRTRQSVADDGDGGCAAGLRAAHLDLRPLADGDPVRTEVDGHSAQVSYAGKVGAAGHAVFLALFDDGWKVTAAGCDRVSDDAAVPYDCAVSGD